MWDEQGAARFVVKLAYSAAECDTILIRREAIIAHTDRTVKQENIHISQQLDLGGYL